MMAEAMINDKLIQATMPALPPAAVVANPALHEHDVDTFRHHQEHQQTIAVSSPKQHQYRPYQHQPNQQTNPSFTFDSRNPTDTSHYQRKSKVVDFELPPPKRLKRHCSTTSVQNAISGIQTCVSSRDRLDAIYDACIKFDHNVQSAHDTEIAMGADIALFKHLPFIILKRERILRDLKQSQGGGSSSSTTSDGVDTCEIATASAKLNQEEYVSIMEEISNTFTALEMVLRCSADSISTCFARIGTELFPILIEFIENLTLELGGDYTVANGTNVTISSIAIKGGTFENEPCKESNHNNNHTSGESRNDLERASTSSTPTQLCEEDGSTNSGIERLKPEAETTTTASTSPANHQSNDKNNKKKNNEKVASQVSLKTCTKIIGHFARVGSLTETLATTPLLLDTLYDVISHSGNNNNEKMPIEATLNSLWIIANLSCSATNMILIAKHDQLKECLFGILSHPNTEEEEKKCEDIDAFIRLLRIRAVAVRAVLNLSWAPENKIPFSENVDLMENLIRIASHSKSKWLGSGRGVSAILLQSRRHACGTLRNLAAAPRKYKRRLCRLESGKFLDILADVAKYDQDQEVQDKIHATLFNLVSADTAKLFTEKKGVLNVIIAAAMNTSGGKEKYNVDAPICKSKKMAENTLRSLEKALPEDDEGYDALRPTLSRFDSQIAMNRINSNLGSVSMSINNFGALPSLSNFSLGDISNLDPETV